MEGAEGRLTEATVRGGERVESMGCAAVSVLLHVRVVSAEAVVG